MHLLGGVAGEVVCISKVGYCSLGNFLQLAVHPNTETMEQAAGAGDDWSAFGLINRLARFEFVGKIYKLLYRLGGPSSQF